MYNYDFSRESNANYFSFEKGGVYCPFVIEKRIVNVRPGHMCATKRTVSVCAVDDNDMQINLDAIIV